MRKAQSAFTLIELMIALAIIGALAGIAVPVYQGYVEKTNTQKAVKDISAIAFALKAYQQDNREFPSSLDQLGITIPDDPWGNPYGYLAIDIDPPPRIGQIRKDKNLHPLNTDFDLYSNGPDGQTQKQLTARKARDDIVRADNGAFIGIAADH